MRQGVVVTDFEVADSSKTKKSKYLEKETSIFLQIKKRNPFITHVELHSKTCFLMEAFNF